MRTSTPKDEEESADLIQAKKRDLALEVIIVCHVMHEMREMHPHEKAARAVAGRRLAIGTQCASPDVPKVVRTATATETETETENGLLAVLSEAIPAIRAKHANHASQEATGPHHVIVTAGTIQYETAPSLVAIGKCGTTEIELIAVDEARVRPRLVEAEGTETGIETGTGKER